MRHRLASFMILLTAFAVAAALSLTAGATRSLATPSPDTFEGAVDAIADFDESVNELSDKRQQLPFPLPGQGPMTCDKLSPTLLKAGFNDPTLIMTDAELIPGSSGQRLCVYYDNLLQTYTVRPINLRSLDELRQQKAEVLPLLTDAGIDPCRIGVWWSGVEKASSINDWHDVGQQCEPKYVAHDAGSERRMEEVRQAFVEAVAKTREVFG